MKFKTPFKKSFYYVVFGCGRLGSIIANELSAKGHSVVVIDRDENSFENLSFDFTGFTLVGEANEIEQMKEAKIEKANGVFVLTPDDNTNIMIALTVKKYFNVDNVIARVYNPKNIKTFAKYKIEIVCPTMLASNRLKKFISKGEKE